MQTSIAELEAALNARPENQTDGPLVPVPHDELLAKRVKIPIWDAISLAVNAEPVTVTKALIKFSVGQDRANIPAGVLDFERKMEQKDRMEANLAKAIETGRPENAEERRLPNRKHDTALALLGGQTVSHIQVPLQMFSTVGLELRDVNVQRGGKGEWVVVFLYTRVPFADGKHFPHCEETRARELEAQFSKDTQVNAGIFLNPNGALVMNVGWYENAQPENVLAIDNSMGYPRLMVDHRLANDRP